MNAAQSEEAAVLWRRYWPLAAVVLLVSGVALAWWLGSDSEDEVVAPAAGPHASRMLPQSVPLAGPPQTPAAATSNVGGLDVMAARLAKRLETDQGDGEGWALLARTYLELGDIAKAEAAYAKALALRPDDKRMQEDFATAKAALLRPGQ